MKPTPIFVAAAGFAMLGACTVKTDENATESADNATAVTTPTGESAAPAADNIAGADTLGNQLNQLKESDAAAANEAENSSSNSGE
jgi:hypothetical protein